MTQPKQKQPNQETKTPDHALPPPQNAAHLLSDQTQRTSSLATGKQQHQKLPHIATTHNQAPHREYYRSDKTNTFEDEHK